MLEWELSVAMKQKQKLFYRGGPVRILAMAEGWAMIRRPRAMPFCVHHADFAPNVRPFVASDNQLCAKALAAGG